MTFHALYGAGPLLTGLGYTATFDRQGEPYFIGREEGVCYLFDHNETMVAQPAPYRDHLSMLKNTQSATVTYGLRSPLT